jgi:hypothetical protein
MRLVLGPPTVAPWPGNPRLLVRVSDDLRKTVVFFGVPTENGTEYGGTGFLLCDHEDGFNFPFLITARHVAKQLEHYNNNSGFSIRVNRTNGEAFDIPVEYAEWTYHSDPTVDLAALLFPTDQEHYDVLYYPLRAPGSEYGPEDRIARYGDLTGVMCGDTINIVGLFRLHHGKQRSVPIVHTGHVAALPDAKERIPVKDRVTSEIVDAECYLVEVQTLDGLSGSPAFVGEALSLNFAEKHHGAQPSVYGHVPVLLGLYTGSWEAGPGDILAKDRNLRGGIRVPIGMGTVVPAHKIVELVRDHPDMVETRKGILRERKERTAATQGSAFPTAKSALPTKDVKGDDRHRERFTALLDAVLGKPKQGG